MQRENELGFRRWLPFSHHLDYMETSRKTKLPLLHKLGYTPTKGTLGNIRRNNIRRMPRHRTSLSLESSLAIPMRVLSFEDSQHPTTLTPVRPVSQTGKAGFGLIAMPGLQPRLCGSAE
jgi:hypothetical protein